MASRAFSYPSPGVPAVNIGHLDSIEVAGVLDKPPTAAPVVVSLIHSLRFLVRFTPIAAPGDPRAPTPAAVVRRSRRPRVRVAAVDRVPWAWLSRSWCDWRSVVQIVRPETVLAWHRRGFRLFWTWTSRRRTGRPPVSSDIRALILDLSTANPLWGAPRVHGERDPRPPSQTWRPFLRNHASQIVAADFFVVPTIWSRTRRGCAGYSRNPSSTTCAPEHILRWAKTRRPRVPSCRRLGGSSRCRKSVGSTTDTIARRRSRRPTCTLPHSSRQRHVRRSQLSPLTPLSANAHALRGRDSSRPEGATGVAVH
jgi:hypothetical protein